MVQMMYLKNKDLKTLREMWVEELDNVCPITKKAHATEEFVIDHQHKLKSEQVSEDGKGLCRGAISRKANAWEGKVSKSFKRVGLHNETDLITALRGLADYLEHNKVHDKELYVHPSEVPKKKKLLKSSYNKLVKSLRAQEYKRQIPKYTGNLTKPLKILYNEVKLSPKLR